MTSGLHQLDPVAVTVWLTPAQVGILRRAADATCTESVSRFLKQSGLLRADRVREEGLNDVTV